MILFEEKIKQLQERKIQYAQYLHSTKEEDIKDLRGQIFNRQELEFLLF